MFTLKIYNSIKIHHQIQEIFEIFNEKESGLLCSVKTKDLNTLEDKKLIFKIVEKFIGGDSYEKWSSYWIT